MRSSNVCDTSHTTASEVVIRDGTAHNADMFDDLNDRDIGVLLAEPSAQSSALARWSERLAQHVQGQGPLDALRLRPESEAPWPQPDNPMLCYLIERTAEIMDVDGPDRAFNWLATHAWLEATIAERGRVARLLVDDL
jgi:hypothetical protein